MPYRYPSIRNKKSQTKSRSEGQTKIITLHVPCVHVPYRHAIKHAIPARAIEEPFSVHYRDEVVVLSEGTDFAVLAR